MKLTFSDVLIVPKFSTINSRSEVDLSNSMGQKLPIISSNMKDITESQMASAMASQGAIGALHRFCSIEENVEMFLNSPKETYCSIGLLDFKRFEVLFNEGANNFIIDTANGSCQQAVETCNYIKNLYSSVNLVVGNFASVDGVIGFLQKVDHLPNALKLGVGSGSICITRVKTGVGYPQLSAIQEIKECLVGDDYSQIKIIADGGITCAGDIAKALGVGADLVMLGSMISGTDETPGEVLKLNDVHTDKNGILSQKWKVYRGSAANNYSNGNRTNEGVESLVPFKGSVIDILKDIEGGLRSSFSYTNSRTLKEFQRNVEFIQISQNSMIEGAAHINGIITKK